MEATSTKTAKSPGRPSARVKKLDRVAVDGTVLRVLGDELLIQVNSSGVKLLMKATTFPANKKLKGSDPVTLTGPVTRIGESLVDDHVPISIHVDGYYKARVTVSAKSVKRA